MARYFCITGLIIIESFLFIQQNVDLLKFRVKLRITYDQPLKIFTKKYYFLKK